MNEVNHRSKNVLGLVQSIVRQTVMTDPDDFKERFNRRIQSLANAQDLIVKHGWKAVPLSELVTSQLDHFADLIGSRISLAGPEVQLTSTASEVLGMAVYELA